MKVCFLCFKVLSERNRLAIILLLKKGKQKVSDLLKNFKICQPTVSHHLAELKRIKMVKAEKRGREIFYSLNRKYPCQGCQIFNQLKVK